MLKGQWAQGHAVILPLLLPCSCLSKLNLCNFIYPWDLSWSVQPSWNWSASSKCTHTNADRHTHAQTHDECDHVSPLRLETRVTERDSMNREKIIKRFALFFAICQAKGKSCVISLAHCYFTMLLCTTLCVCPGQDWTLNTMTSPTLIRTVIVPHLTKAYVDFLFPMKLFSEQHVPQCVHRFLDFVFCSILLMSLSWFWF